MAPGATRSRLSEARGDNKQFRLELLNDDGFDAVKHQAAFAPSGNDGQTLNRPITALVATLRGRDVSGAAPLAPTSSRQVGLVIGAGQAGPFALHIGHSGLV
jgi:hypothetical protein